MIVENSENWKDKKIREIRKEEIRDKKEKNNGTGKITREPRN